ncbi:ANTAR domain-containing protein [Spongisporangium articulatum]|uniref:ANTAR domain-containing protein n=1 Tax=Spongisporangium articulatum TaxID=3362603 RepID=A0ABW8AJC6_9ACTN
MTQILSDQVDRLPEDAGPQDLADLLHRADATGEPVSSLRGAVNLCLDSEGPALLVWGDDRRVVYNQAFLDFAPTPPAARFGEALHQGWPEAWAVLGPHLQQVFATGQTRWIPKRETVITRHGVQRETSYTCHLSPALDGAGEVRGVHVSILDITRGVQLKRRLGTLRRLAADGVESGSPEVLYDRLAETLGDAHQDIPFSLLYSAEPRDRRAALRAASGLCGGSSTASQSISLDDAALWPVVLAASQGTPVLVDDLPTRFPGLELSCPEAGSVERAFVGVVELGERLPRVVNILGVSNRLALDAEYQAFLFDVFRQVSGVLGVVAAARRDREKVANLERAVESNRQIGAAIGILMMGHKLTEEQAFNTLSRVSQRSNRKLREIADDVVRTGSIALPAAQQ